MESVSKGRRYQVLEDDGLGRFDTVDLLIISYMVSGSLTLAAFSHHTYSLPDALDYKQIN